MKSAGWLPLLGLLLLTFFQRGAVYSAPRIDLFGIYGGGTNADADAVVAGEERARINVALDLREGPVMPLIDYQYANYCGGSLVVSLLLVPVIEVFGPTVWALRFFALTLNLVALVCLFAVLDRWVSRRAAIFGGLLWALATPGLLINTMVVWGTHVESNVLALGTLWLFLSIHASPERRTAKRWWLGVMQGLNFYIGYQTVLAIAMLGFFDLFPKRFPKPKEWLAQIVGLLIGASPWLWYNLRNDFSGLRIYEHQGSENLAAEGAFSKWTGLFGSDLPTGQWFQKSFPAWGATFDGIYVVVLLGAALLGMLWWRRRSPQGDSQVPSPGHLAGIYLLGFCAMYAFTRFGVTPHEDVFGYRYPLIAMPWLILAAGVGFDRLASWGTVPRALAWVLSLGLAGVSLAAIPGLTRAERFGVERTVEVQNLPSHTLWMFASYRQFPERYPALIRSLRAHRTPEEFETMMRSLGRAVQWLGADQPGFQGPQLEFAAQLRRMREILLQELPPEMHAWFPEPGS
ncbi:MAG: glycosyltransferase family 39 protein [Planctomycetes bacterium]|nr:glycosyltransferase family 39 protein [Planctomycetota bacterium]HPF14266.1 glycosyltransferase family 39 protein [Planctomycetota bacterium]